ncbi:MAG: DUF3253 domain-containing protein [Bacteroidota bacterium]
MKPSKPEIEAKILQLTEKRGVEQSISSSEIARELFSDTWRNYMDEVHMSAVSLQKKGLISIAGEGKEMDMSEGKGPIRLSIKK